MSAVYSFTLRGWNGFFDWWGASIGLREYLDKLPVLSSRFAHDWINTCFLLQIQQCWIVSKRHIARKVHIEGYLLLDRRTSRHSGWYRHVGLLECNNALYSDCAAIIMCLPPSGSKPTQCPSHTLALACRASCPTIFLNVIMAHTEGGEHPWNIGYGSKFAVYASTTLEVRSTILRNLVQ